MTAATVRRVPRPMVKPRPTPPRSCSVAPAVQIQRLDHRRGGHCRADHRPSALQRPRVRCGMPSQPGDRVQQQRGRRGVRAVRAVERHALAVGRRRGMLRGARLPRRAVLCRRSGARRLHRRVRCIPQRDGGGRRRALHVQLPGERRPCVPRQHAAGRRLHDDEQRRHRALRRARAAGRRVDGHALAQEDVVGDVRHVRRRLLRLRRPQHRLRVGRLCRGGRNHGGVDRALGHPAASVPRLPAR